MKTVRLSSHQIPLALAIQKTSSHCGPAVIQMLLAHVGKKASQDEIVEAGRIKMKIKKYGMQPNIMVTALKTLAPKYTLWFKQKATLHDITSLIENYHYPIGINWQGLFYDSVKEEKKSGSHSDRGHYSVIVDVSRDHSKIAILDPYRAFAVGPRIFSYRWFSNRWWDFVMESDQANGKAKRIDTCRFLFIITPKKAIFPKSLGMQPAEKLSEIFS